MTSKPIEHVKDLMQHFDSVMMITHSLNGKLHARPMHIAEISPQGILRFATSLVSPKIKEISADDQINLLFQKSSRFLSLEGTAKIEKNSKLIDQLWSETWRVWFPEGKDDPNIGIISVVPKHAEFWDSSGARGIAYVFEAAKAYVQGKQPGEDPKLHGKVSM